MKVSISVEHLVNGSGITGVASCGPLAAICGRGHCNDLTVSTTLQSVAFGTEPGLAPLSAPATIEEWWLSAVALGGQGRYAQARAALNVVDRRTAGLAADGDCVYASLSASTRASFLRQTGWHAKASYDDGRALAIVAGRGDSPELVAAACDALTGLAADALGQGRLALGWRLLERCAEQINRLEGESARLWRQVIRLEWVSAELALASGDFTRALRHAERAVELAAGGDSLRHKVKSDLLRCAALTGFDPGQAAMLAGEVFDECRSSGLLPLAWASSMLIEGVSGSPTTPNSAALGAAVAARGGVFRELSL